MVLGFWQKKEKLLSLNFRGLFFICFLTLGTFLPEGGGRGWERRAGGASSCLMSHRGPFALGAHPCRVWDAVPQLQQQLQAPHSLQSWQGGMCCFGGKLGANSRRLLKPAWLIKLSLEQHF